MNQNRQNIVDDFRHSIFQVKAGKEFNDLAVKIFHFQFEENPVFHAYVSQLNIDHRSIDNIIDIPFLPIEFFRDHEVICGKPGDCEKVFFSSGTTGSVPGRHFVSDLSIYRQSFIDGFRLFYGDPMDWCILALLPGYLERPDSSLVYMMDHLIDQSRPNGSGFFLENREGLAGILASTGSNRRKVLLLGVTYALLDLAEEYELDMPEVVVMETGGMKGRRREMVRDEVHAILCKAFGVKAIHSEYGMTELLSQAYSKGEGYFRTPPWMKVMIRDINDPFTFLPLGKTGGINVIDLANFNSCCFVETMDLGRCNPDGTFEVLGRFDSSDTRGCNLMVG